MPKFSDMSDCSEDDEFNMENLPARSQSNRITKHPNRYGTFGDDHDHEGEISTEADDFSGDDSDDFFRLPPEKRHRKETNSAKTTKRQLDNHHDEHTENVPISIDFNAQFTQLTRSLSSNASSTSVSSLVAPTVNRTVSKDTNNSVDSSKIGDDNAQTEMMVLTNKIDHLIKVLNDQNAQFKSMTSNFNELYAKYSVLEKVMLNSGNFSIEAIEGPKLADSTMSDAFIAANELPIKTEDSLRKFDLQLTVDAIQTNAIDAVSKLLVKKQKTKSRAPLKIIKDILDILIDRRFLAEITWSGRSTPGKSKISFKDKKGILQLVFKIVSQTHPNYDPDEFKENMVDNIFKFAYIIPLHLLTEEERALKEAKKTNGTKKGSAKHHGELGALSQRTNSTIVGMQNEPHPFSLPSKQNIQPDKSSSVRSVHFNGAMNKKIISPASAHVQLSSSSSSLTSERAAVFPMFMNNSNMYHSSFGHGHSRPLQNMHDLMARGQYQSRGRMLAELAQHDGEFESMV